MDRFDKQKRAGRCSEASLKHIVTDCVQITVNREWGVAHVSVDTDNGH